jgi:hypothetical protein
LRGAKPTSLAQAIGAASQLLLKQEEIFLLPVFEGQSAFGVALVPAAEEIPAMDVL